jgi:hypothetical protein
MKAILAYAIPLLSIAIGLSLHRNAVVYDFPTGNKISLENGIFISYH